VCTGARIKTTTIASCVCNTVDVEPIGGVVGKCPHSRGYMGFTASKKILNASIDNNNSVFTEDHFNLHLEFKFKMFFINTKLIKI